MTDYYVDNGREDDAGDGTSWATAKKLLASGVALATTAGDVVWVKNVSETVSGSITLTCAADIRVISATGTGNVPATGFDITANTGTITLQGGPVTFYGCDFIATGAGTDIIISNTANDKVFLQSCALTLGASTSGTSFIFFGVAGAVAAESILTDCTITFGNNAAQGLQILSGAVQFIGCTFAFTTTIPTVFIAVSDRGGDAKFIGCDISSWGTDEYLVESTPTTPANIEFIGCKLGSGVVAFAPSAVGSGEVTLRDCSTGDTHYEFAHYTYEGKTEISTSVYVTADGASYDGTNKHSWIITGTNCTKANPYYSPWIDRYFAPAGTPASLSPYLECLITSGSSVTTPKDNELWSEWAAKTTSGQALYSFLRTDYGGHASTADQGSSSLGAGDWTGESANNWFGKLAPTSFTAQEIGHVRARVGLASAVTVYVDPQIRGLS